VETDDRTTGRLQPLAAQMLVLPGHALAYWP
jgi:hypothetical protein